MKEFDRKVMSVIAGVVFTLALGGVVMIGAVRALSNAAADVQLTQMAMVRLSAVVNNLGLAQSGQRDFLLTGDVQQLESCQDALFAVDQELGGLRSMRHSPELAQRLAELEPLLVRQVDFYKRTFEARKKRGPGAAAALLRREGSGATLERIQQKAEAILQQETLSLRGRFDLLDSRLRMLRWVVALCGLFAFGLMAMVYRLVHQEMTTRQAAMQGLERSLQEVNKLGDLVEALQASQNVDEVCATAGPLIKGIFQGMSGGLALLSPKRKTLDLRYAFGELESQAASFPAQDCWGLRRGQAHLDLGDQGMSCAHLHADPGMSTYCAPLMAQGETIGLMSLLSAEPRDLDERRQKLALVVGEQISLALANLALRDKLKDQSILDPLTGLFNRRYMEESFERERRRHHDKGRAFGLAMVDIDHFKQFNDRFGHEAGDFVLKELGGALRRSLRPSDILCRFGGEELVVLLPEADLEQALKAAEHCRKAVQELSLEFRGKSLGKVTISVGVAAYPEDGDTVEKLMKKADVGLYQAKHAGRNQVMHFKGTPPAEAA